MFHFLIYGQYYIYIYIYVQSARAVEYTDCTSIDEYDLSNKFGGNDTRQFDGEVPVMLEFWGKWSTSSLPSLPGPLLPRVVASDRVLSMDEL